MEKRSALWRLRGNFYHCESQSGLLSLTTSEADQSFRPQVSEAAVVGITSEQWGQKVAAVVVLNPTHAQTGKGGKTWGAMDMRRALKDKLANYKIPQELKAVDELPKNAMGKSMYFQTSFLLLSADRYESQQKRPGQGDIR